MSKHHGQPLVVQKKSNMLLDAASYGYFLGPKGLKDEFPSVNSAPGRLGAIDPALAIRGRIDLAT